MCLSKDVNHEKNNHHIDLLGGAFFVHFMQ